ncbi:acid protease [Lentinus brumalis]|uniref:Acid protease n=1 Tax=Lentinus brumalis TaxID=2498619 RepID=A0A371D986_9APHY|nr:acid protease [Polyporus brumalis]
MPETCCASGDYMRPRAGTHGVSESQRTAGQRTQRPERDAPQGCTLRWKHGVGGTIAKRSSGLNFIKIQKTYSRFYGSIAAGTRRISYTSSSDCWRILLSVTHSSRRRGRIRKPPSTTYLPRSRSSLWTGIWSAYTSSTITPLNRPFSISYNSGAARGNLGQDSVQFAGFEVSDQVFATPLWQALAESSGTLDQPLMAFQLTRFVDVQNAPALEPGGAFNLGAVNTSLYTGDMDYQPIPEGQEGYWIQELAGLTVNGQSLSLDAGSASYAAIDTDTTLVGGPADSISALYAQIPSSKVLTGDDAGYYKFTLQRT